MYRLSGDTSSYEGIMNSTGNPAVTSLNLTGLDTGSSYIFLVRAINAVGTGAVSLSSDEVSSRMLRYEQTRNCALPNAQGVCCVLTYTVTKSAIDDIAWHFHNLQECQSWENHFLLRILMN